MARAEKDAAEVVKAEAVEVAEELKETARVTAIDLEAVAQANENFARSLGNLAKGQEAIFKKVHRGRVRWAVAQILTVSVFAVYVYSEHRDDQAICAVAQRNRDGITAVVTKAYQPGPGLPLTAPPEFAALDPETQAYLAALEARSSSPEAAAATLARRDELLAALPPLGC